ncbi:MAG: hypothetical protein FWE25_11125 [Lachnospiraceae bacterium]|nr:hypothetical protein [Lachnospiraceae bacterium]
MKKLLLLLAMMLLSAAVLVGCGGSDNGASDTGNGTNNETTEETGDDSWREVIRDYEAMMNRYIDLLERAQDDPADIELITEITDMMPEIIEWETRLAELEGTLSGNDLAEFIEIQNGLLQRLEPLL